MPEGPEVLLTALELNEALKGLYLNHLSIMPGAHQTNLQTLRLPAKLTHVSYYAKRILFVLEEADGNSAIIGSFLGMEGHWGWDPNKNHIFLILEFGSLLGGSVFLTQKTLYYDDTRHFGFMKLLRTPEDSAEFFKNLGVDLLIDSAKITSEFWHSKITNRHVKKMQVCSFLVSPKYFSGVGNYLKSEILYRSRIRPDRELQTLTDQEVETLRCVTLATIRESFENGGLTIATFYTPSGKMGGFTCYVYNMENKINPHGYLVRRDTFKDGRSTYWTPQIQV